MKRKSIISLLIFCMGLSLTTSCEDMLTPSSERHSYEVGKDTLYSYWGILKSLQNVAERYVILNECRGDLVSGTPYVSDSINAILSFGMAPYEELYKDGSCAYLQVRDYYHVINSCNAYIDMCDITRTTGLARLYMIKELAQVKAIRAWVYMQLVNAYGEVPFVDKPLLTTDAINEFWGNGAYPTVNAENLYTKFAAELQEMYTYEKDGEYGFPQYESYGDINSGDANYVCHSTKAMFPIAIVLGDLYLMGNRYDEAAEWYFTFLNYKYGGPIPVNRYVSVVETRQGVDGALYTWTSSPFRETGALSRSNESITCIPSVKGRLDGTVLTDIGRLFGWDADLRAGTAGNSASSDDDGSKTTSSVSLTRNFEHELGESAGYDSLSFSQNYDYVWGRNSGQTILVNAVLPLLREGNEKTSVGDARRSWLYSGTGRLYTEAVEGAEAKFGTFVSKQNPGGAFTTVYPMVYRKGMVWLRFAEALNRAGYPSIAFSILRDGMCTDPSWYPTENDYNEPETQCYVFQYTDTAGQVVIIPENWEENKDIVFNVDSEEEAILAYDNANAAVDAAYEAAEGDEATQECILAGSFKIYWLTTKPYIGEDLQQYPIGPACFYINREELNRFNASKKFVLDQVYMKASGEQRKYYYKRDISDYKFSSYTNAAEADHYVSMGIHARGGGVIRIQDRLCSYQYVDMVQKKVKEAGHAPLTLNQIYAKQAPQELIEAVEDLIVDEMGLELAFEGTRFSDLARVAGHRGDNAYLAKRVAKRNGKTDDALLQHLMTKKNWYLPLPLR